MNTTTAEGHGTIIYHLLHVDLFSNCAISELFSRKFRVRNSVLSVTTIARLSVDAPMQNSKVLLLPIMFATHSATEIRPSYSELDYSVPFLEACCSIRDPSKAELLKNKKPVPLGRTLPTPLCLVTHSSNHPHTHWAAKRQQNSFPLPHSR